VYRLSGRRFEPGQFKNVAFRAQHSRRDAQLRLLMIDLAIRLFRERHERLPDTLDELAPDFLTAVPIDPFSGKPFVYRRDGDEYALYSVGVDAVDDDGKLPSQRWELDEAGFDLDLEAATRIPPMRRPRLPRPQAK
jgi:hypothetical protein